MLCVCVSQFSLIAGLIRYLFSKTEINVLILGLDYAGKTVSSVNLPCVFGAYYVLDTRHSTTAV